MKNFILTFALSFITLMTYAQDLEQFYMPKIQNEQDCAKYIGKQVSVFDYTSPRNKRWDDSFTFDNRISSVHYNSIYTIKKIKFGKQIEMQLVSNAGVKYKVKINNGGPKQYGELSSTNIFFLWDEFYAYQKEQIGKIFKNTNNEEVAVLENLELFPRIDEDPQLVSTIKSKLNDEIFLCYSNEAEKLCSHIGTILSDPRVKYSYRVLSGHTISLGSDSYDENFKYIYAERPWYTNENTTTGEIKHCSGNSIPSGPFEYDLAGEYISLLSEVDKPTNSNIRYGETTTIPSEDGISKFSYKDDFIDIIIFADKSSFNFILKNISDSSIKIIWDDAVFVNFDGSTEKVMHKGIKFFEKNAAQPATTIIKNAKWEDTVTPTHLVYYRESTKYTEGGWDKKSMYPKEKALKPGQVKLMLPIQLKDIVNEYIFVFDVQYVYKYPERLNMDVIENN